MKKLSHHLYSFILILFSANVAAQPTKIKLQLKWWHQFQFAGFYAADIKGFYKSSGLNVELIPGDAKRSPVAEVLKGNADFGISGTGLLINYADGMPVKVLGAIFQHSPYVIISAKEKNILTPKDLIGKKVMGEQEQGWLQVKALAIKNKISLNEIKLLKHTRNNNDLTNGYADAMIGYSSVEIYQLQQKGVDINIIYPSQFGIDFYGDVIFSLNKTVSNKPDLTERFLKASYKGWDYALKHPSEIADYILTLPGVKERGVTKEQLLFEALEMENLMLPSLVEMGQMSETRWIEIMNVYKSLEMISKTPDLDDFIYDYKENSLKSSLQLGLYILGAILILMILLAFYSISLQKAVKNRTLALQNEVKQRRQNEATLEKVSKELQVSNNELQQFAYLTSHNLRAPATNINTLIQLINRQGLSEKNADYIQKLELTSKNLNEMLDDLNEILSVRKEDQQNFELLSFETILEKVTQSISENILEHGLIIKTDFSKAPEVMGSSKILHNTVLNLLTNAIKYRKPGEVPEVYIRTDETIEYIILTVTDKGIGIDLNKYGDKIFKLYQRFHNNADSKGLGLYLIKSQLEKMDGKIIVDSEQGKGTTFKVYFRK
jgi:signal transduction histidine kinase